MVSGTSYTIALTSSFSIYMITDSEAYPQEVCSFDSLGREVSSHPALIEIRETLTGSGHYRVYCQVVSDTPRPHESKPTSNEHFTWETYFFDNMNLFTMPDILKFSQWFDNIPFQRFSQQTTIFIRKIIFHQYGYQS